VAVSALNYVPVLFIAVQESISYSWFCTGTILVTGESAGFLLLTTRPTREGKYLRALEVRVATWVLLIGEKNGFSRSD
jgi:hypothetical protein